MNSPQIVGSSAQHRWVHGTNPWQGASMVLSTALLGGASATAGATRHSVGRLAPNADFDAAIARYERGEWASAYEMLERLADEGDALAAKLALLMLRYGAPMYGTRFHATARQVARWARLVLAARQ